MARQHQSPRSFLGQARGRRKQLGRRRKNSSTSLFRLIIGQSLGLDARFGDQIASFTLGWVKSRARGGVEKSPLGREVARGRDELTARKDVQGDILAMLIEPTPQNKKDVKNEG